MAKQRGIDYRLIEQISAAGGKALHCWLQRSEDRDSLFGEGGIFEALRTTGFEVAMPGHLQGVPGAPGKLAYMQAERENSAMCIVFINSVVNQGVLVTIVIYWQEDQETLAHAKLAALPGQLRLSPHWEEIPGDVTEAVELAKAMNALAIELINVT